MPCGLGLGHGTVPGRGLFGEPLHLGLQLGQLLGLPGDDTVALPDEL